MFCVLFLPFGNGNTIGEEFGKQVLKKAIMPVLIRVVVGYRTSDHNYQLNEKTTIYIPPKSFVIKSKEEKNVIGIVLHRKYPNLEMNGDYIGTRAYEQVESIYVVAGNEMHRCTNNIKWYEKKDPNASISIDTIQLMVNRKMPVFTFLPSKEKINKLTASIVVYDSQKNVTYYYMVRPYQPEDKDYFMGYLKKNL